MRTFPECGHTRHAHISTHISALTSFTSTKMGFHAVASTTRGCLKIAFLGKERKTDPRLQFLSEMTTGKGANCFGLGHMLIPGPVPNIWSMGYYNWSRQHQMPTLGAEGQVVCGCGDVHTHVCMYVGKAEEKIQ